MPIISNGTKIKEVSYGTTSISKVYYGSSLVWQAIPDVLVFPDGLTGTGARDFFRSELTARGLDYAKIVEVPFKMDTSNVTSMNGMFSDCSSLTSVPDLDTSKVTDMNYMFEDCWSLTSVPVLDTSNVTSMTGMFMNCESLTSVPDLDISKVTDTSYMFMFCSSLTDGNVRLISVSGPLLAKARDMITESGLTRRPFFDADGNPIP